MSPKYQIFLCDLINPVNDKKAELLRDGAMVLIRKSNGKYYFEKWGKEKKILAEYKNKKSIEIIDRRSFTALPPFYDVHFHWVQDEVRLMAKDNLLSWLKNYTWPYEEKFNSAAYSKKRANIFKQELLQVGTLGGAVYSSIHSHTVDHAIQNFIGDFFVGNVLMTMNSPEDLTYSISKSIEIVEKLSDKYRKNYAVTPRFAPTTHPEVMAKTAKLGIKRGSLIQTHLAETLEEIDYVISLYRQLDGFETIESYTEIYQLCGLLTERTIMGHGIYLSPKELKLLAKFKTKIAHCPTSNAETKDLGLGSGLFDYKNAERFGVEWSLATDIGGGPYLSMIDVMNSFVGQNRERGHKDVTFSRALNRATLKGAELLGIAHKTGNFAPGKEANFVFLDSPEKCQKENAESVLEKLISQYSNNRELYQDIVKETYYMGKRVFKNKG